MEERPRRSHRWLALLLLLLLFGGLIAYSTVGVSFDVSGTSMSEYQVLEGSLTHAVQRGPNGALIAPQAGKPTAGTDAKGAAACPT